MTCYHRCWCWGEFRRMESPHDPAGCPIKEVADGQLFHCTQFPLRSNRMSLALSFAEKVWPLQVSLISNMDFCRLCTRTALNWQRQVSDENPSTRVSQQSKAFGSTRRFVLPHCQVKKGPGRSWGQGTQTTAGVLGNTKELRHSINSCCCGWSNRLRYLQRSLDTSVVFKNPWCLL